MRTPLAERMFDGVLEDLSDKSLNQMYNELKELKEKSFMTFRSLCKTPFVKQLFEMIEDEHEYRNQMVVENNF